MIKDNKIRKLEAAAAEAETEQEWKTTKSDRWIKKQTKKISTVPNLLDDIIKHIIT